ncbi:MAG: hypothetical protein II221_03060 [Paludibacteraceae bacterium]|nr:hypothetical protein [Paludibacteraceae bacterium]
MGGLKTSRPTLHSPVYFVFTLYNSLSSYICRDLSSGNPKHLLEKKPKIFLALTLSGECTNTDYKTHFIEDA